MVKPTYEELESEVSRLRAHLEERYDDVRLVEMKGGEMVLEGGPLHFFAAYMAEVLGHKSGKDLANYVEMALNHDRVGAMTVTLQRASGKTPHALRQEAETEVEALKVALHAALCAPKGVVPAEAEAHYDPALAARMSA